MAYGKRYLRNTPLQTRKARSGYTPLPHEGNSILFPVGSETPEKTIITGFTKRASR